MAKKEKRDVLIPHKFLPIFETLSKQGKGEQGTELIISILRFDMCGEEPTFADAGVQFVWDSVIKPQLEENLQKYKDVSKARSEAVGAKYQQNSSKSTNATNVANVDKSEQNAQTEQMNTIVTDYDVDIDVDVDSDSNINISKEMYVPQECDEPTQNGKNDFTEIVDSWNRLPVTNIKVIQGTRLKMLKARLKDYTQDEILSAISNIREQPFLLGQNKNGWQITFDWFLKPNNFVKVYEGNYKDTQKTHSWNDAQMGYEGAMRNLEGLIDEQDGT